jgi:O-6-methylguanine DNA methyltransferase
MGLVLVAVSSKGVCAVLLGSDARALVADLRRRFPAAEVMHQEIASVLCARHVIAVIESPETPLDVPLDLRGSEVQRSIWHAVRDIPVGSTASYKEIAKKIGVPTTAQDVSDACAANALAVVVPCHRVIRSDGSLSGYRWGSKRKQALLDKERQVARDSHEVRHHTASSPAATAARSSRRQTHWISCSSGRALPHASGERGPSPLGRRQGAVPHRVVTSRARLRRASGASRLMQSREFREAFPDLNFWAVGELIAEGDYVVGRWDGGGTHTGPAFDDLPVGLLPANSGKTIRFTGTTVFRLVDGKVAEEIGEEGALTALQQLGLVPQPNAAYAERLARA